MGDRFSSREATDRVRASAAVTKISRHFYGTHMDREILKAFDCELRDTAARLAKTRSWMATCPILAREQPESERVHLHRLRFVSARRKKLRALLDRQDFFPDDDVIRLLGVNPEAGMTERQDEIFEAVRLARCEGVLDES